MAYIRKTRDEYVLQQNWGYGYGWEDIVTYDDYAEARADKKAYLENQPGVPTRLITRRVKIETAKEV